MSLTALNSSVLTPARKLWTPHGSGIWTIIDDEHFPWIVENSWNARVGGTRYSRHKLYVKRNVGEDRKPIYLHRAILMRADPKPDWFMQSHVVDHINGQTLDNRVCNLRWANHSENAKNAIPKRQIPSVLWIWRNFCVDATLVEECPF